MKIVSVRPNMKDETFVERVLMKDIPIEVGKEELFRVLKMPKDTEPEDIARILEMMQDCQKIANPKAVYGVAAIEEKGNDYVVIQGRKIVSPLVRKNLEQVNRVIPFVVTCGTEAEEWSHQFTDILESYWADEIKLILLGRIRKVLADTVKEKYFPNSDMSAMSPGSLVEWPLTEQKNLFALIGEVQETVGVELTDSCLMLPSKSGSGFFFSAASHYENCALCPILDCPNRRAEFVGSR